MFPTLNIFKTLKAETKYDNNKKRQCLVQNPDFKVKEENVEVVHSLLQIQELIEGEEETFVIGGAMIYNFLMGYVKKMYVTEIDKEFDGDTFFPRINEEIWKETERVEGLRNEEHNLDYSFVTYLRK